MNIRSCAILLLIGAFIIAGCAGSRRVEEKGKQREEFDPQTLNDDDILIQSEKEETKVGTVPQQTGGEPSPQPSPGGGRRLVEAYRVQLIATSTREAAERVKEEALQQFDVGVYVEYHPPFYKVMIGDCRTREDADALIEQAKMKGYTAPLRVQTDVWAEGGEIVEISGWRVQLYADTDRRKAQTVKEEASRRLGQAVYVEFIEPYYRVRVGNCRTEDEAREIAKEAKKNGYPDAFPVRSLITLTN
jgi:cell division protein FtsN